MHPVRHLGSPLEGRVQVPGRIPQRSQARIGLPRRVVAQGRLTFISNVSSVRRPEDVGRRCRRQLCRSCASPNTATQWLLWSRPDRVTHGGYSLSPPLREIEVSKRKTPVCVLLKCSGTRGLYGGTTRSLECACASSLAAFCPVHVLQAQHKWARELARTNGKSLCRAPLFPASSADVVTKVQVSSTVSQAASLLGMPLETLTEAKS